MRDHLKRPMTAALAMTIVLVLVQVALLAWPSSDTQNEELSRISPTGTEVAYTAGSFVVMFLVLWVVIALLTRFASRRGRTRD